MNNGVCLENTCPAGQYKLYGNCFPNPTGCDNYTIFTLCTKCSTGYTLTNRACSLIPVICNNRTYFNSTINQCLPVDSKCNQFNSLNGDCLSCIDQSQYLSAGKCNTANCTNNQYLKNGIC